MIGYLKIFAAFAVFSALITTVFLMSCDDAAEAYNCADICETYEDCVDEDIDILDCTNDCEDRADVDEDFADRLDDCEDCLDEGACLDKIFQCSEECAGIVPPTS